MLGLVSPIRAAINFALPPRCPGCGVVVDADRRFCTDCWRALDFLGGEGCASCNLPLESALTGMICADCLAAPPVHDGVRAVVAYGPIARSLVLKLKHGRKPGQAAIIGEHLARRIDAASDALLVPVPLHRRRLWLRGFNQSVMIGRVVSRISGVPLAIDCLQRSRATPMLGGLGRVRRARAVRGAFRVPEERAALLAGRTIYLVDDVYTSGATANSCARALKRAGAAQVIVLCWARVIRDEAGY
jgi:ComF family protein